MRGVAPESLDGRTFGLLTVVREAATRTRAGKRRFVCRCACGKRKTLTGADIKSGRTTSCGCVRDKMARERQYARRDDLTGREFADGIIKVIGPASEPRRVARGSGRVRAVALWRCECACGVEFTQTASALRIGQVTSCGCIRRAHVADRIERNALRYPWRGREATISEIAAESGVEPATLRYRLRRLGMSVEDATTLPMMRNGRRGVPKKDVPF